MAKRSLIRSAGAALSSVALAAALVPMAAFAEGGAQLTAWTEIDLGDAPAGPSIVQVVTRAISAAAAETETDGILADTESLAEAARTAGAQAAHEAQAGSTEAAKADDQQAESAQDEPTADAQDEGDNAPLGAQAVAEDPENATSDSAAAADDEKSNASDDGTTLTAQKSIRDALSDSSSGSSTISSQEDTPTTTTSSIAANSVVWAYNATDATALGDSSAVISNGAIEVISVGSTTASTLISNASSSTKPYFKAYASSTSDSTSTDSSTSSSTATTTTTTATTSSATGAGTLCAEGGETVTVKLMPARGYQLTTTELGDIDLTAVDNTTGYYTFEMPEESAPFVCSFTATQDAVDVDGTDVITAGSISNATSAAANGTLRLTIEDIDDSTAKKGLSDAASKLGAKTSDIVGYVDMELDNVIYQGDEGDVPWETALTDLSSPITMTLTLSNDATSGASAFYIVREHNGTYSNATATYDSTAKTITFTSNAFSDFAIVKGTPSSSTNTNNTSTTNNNTSSGATTPATGDTNDPAPFVALAVAAGAVAAFAVARIRRKA